MKGLTLVPIFLVLLGCAGGPWSTRDKALFATYTIANVIDVLQTREIYDNPDFYEKNFIFTKNNYIPLMVGANILAYLILDAISSRHRTKILIPLCGITVGNVGNNYFKVGIRF